MGALENRKNVIGMIKAFLEFNKNKHYQFVLAINLDNKLPKDIQQFILNREKEFVFLKFLHNRDLAFIYKHSSLFFFATLYEGFGLPVLEAMASGVPVITSNVSSLPEVGQDGVLYVNPYNIEEMSGALLRLTQNEELRLKLINRGKEIANKFKWETCAKETVKILLKIAA